MEFMEYAQAFMAGRNYASEFNAIYTLSMVHFLPLENLSLDSLIYIIQILFAKIQK